MSIRLVMFNRIPRFFPRRQYATSLKDYESLYDLMEVEPSCTKTEIRESWLRLSMMYHPDLNKDSEEAKEKFMKIKDAYKILNNEEARMKYNDQIGFHHHDPPPDFHHKWSYEGEKNKMSAKQYYRWDEAKIKDLMSSEALREVNWKDKTPSDRYKILMEEERRRQEELDIAADTETPEVGVLMQRLTLIFVLVGILAGFAYRVIVIEESEEVIAQRKEAERRPTDIEINGTLILAQARHKSDVHISLLQSINNLIQRRKEKQTQEKENMALDSIMAIDQPQPTS